MVTNLKVAIGALLLAISISTCMTAKAELELRLVDAEDAVLVLLINNASFSKTVIKRLCNDAMGKTELALIVTNIEGRDFPFLSKLDGTDLEPEDFASIDPGSIVGERIRLTRIIEDYYLAPGEYKVRAVYTVPPDLVFAQGPDGFDAYPPDTASPRIKLESNTLIIRVTERNGKAEHSGTSTH